MPNLKNPFPSRRTIELLLAAALAIGACHAPNSAPTDTAIPAPAVKHPTVVSPAGIVFEVEIAADDPTRQQGLMYRESLAPRRGMLFLFPATEIYPFWMKNTVIPLDMIWIDQGGRIVHIEARVPPCPGDPCPSYSPRVPARYVLELAGGEAEAAKLKEGDQLQLRNMEGIEVR